MIAANPLVLLGVAIVALVGLIVELVKHWNDVAAVFDKVRHDVAAIVTGMWHDVTGFFSKMYSDVTGTVSKLSSDVTGFFRRLWSDVVGEVSAGVGLVIGWVERLFDDFVSTETRGIDNIVSWFKGLPGRILSAVGDLGSLLFNAGEKVVQGLINGIKSMIGDVGCAIGSVVSEIKNFLPFSPAKKGPLSGSGRAGQLRPVDRPPVRAGHHGGRCRRVRRHGEGGRRGERPGGRRGRLRRGCGRGREAPGRVHHGLGHTLLKAMQATVRQSGRRPADVHQESGVPLALRRPGLVPPALVLLPAPVALELLAVQLLGDRLDAALAEIERRPGVPGDAGAELPREPPPQEPAARPPAGDDLLEGDHAVLERVDSPVVFPLGRLGTDLLSRARLRVGAARKKKLILSRVSRAPVTRLS